MGNKKIEHFGKSTSGINQLCGLNDHIDGTIDMMLCAQDDDMML